MLAAAPASPLRDAKPSRRSAAPKRSATRKDKVNVVSKASLAMLNPAYAMGIDVAPSWCDSPLSASAAQDEESYDSLREWGAAGPAAAGALARSVAKAGDELGGTIEAWRSRPYWAQQHQEHLLQSDANWRMSPTPELEAFTVEELDVCTSASASSSTSDLPMGEFASDYSLDPPSVEYGRSSFEHDDDEVAAPVAPAVKTRKSKTARMTRRASEDEQAHSTVMPIAGGGSKGSKSPHSNSLSRFFSWKRSTKHLGGSRAGAGMAVPPLPSFDGAGSFDEYAAMPMSAPPAVTTFDAALAGTGAPRHRYGIEESYPAQRLERGGRPSLAVENEQQLGSGSSSAPCTPVRAPQGLPAAPQPQPQQQSVAQRASKFLGRKYSMPTLREVRRAQASAVGGTSNEANAVVWGAEAAQVGVMGSMPLDSAAPAPSLPPLFGAEMESMSPIIPSTSSSSGDGWGSTPRSRISSVGRGTARKGTDSIYDGISSPRSPSTRSPKLSGARKGEFVVDEEHSLAYAGVVTPLKALASEPRLGQGGGSFAEKAMRRRSRSMGSATAPPPRLSRFGSPPTGFTPTSPYVSTFSPVLNSHNPLPGLGRGRGVPTQRGNGTPTQQSVAAFGAGRGAAMSAAAAAAAAVAQAEEAQPRSSSEGETVQQARRVNLGGGRAGVRAVAVASPTLVARSPRMPQQALNAGRSRSPLRPRQEKAQTKPQLPVIVNVMPPTPVLCDENGASFEGDKPSLAPTTDGYGPVDDEGESSEDEEEPIVQRRPRAAASPRSAMAALRRDTVVIDSATWMPEAFDVPTQGLPYTLPSSFAGGAYDMEEKLRERRPSLASSELSDMDESVASSEGGEPFALARSLSSHSLASVASSVSDASSMPYGSPLRTNQSMASSITASSTSSRSQGSSLGLRGMQFDSSSSLCSSTTTSTSILDFGMTSASSSIGIAKEALRQPFNYAPASSVEPLGEDCETPRLSGGAAQIAVFASPVRAAAPLASSTQLRSSPERIASPLLELDLSLPLDLDSLSNAVGLAALHSPKRTLRSPGGAARGKAASPIKPPKSRARVEQQRSKAVVAAAAAPTTPPSSSAATTRESVYDGASFDEAGLGLGLGLDFGAPQPHQQQEAPKQTQALRVVKRTQEPKAEHAALWGELGFAM
jgi:hypothetical protein